MKKTALYDMSYGEWGMLFRSFDGKYDLSESGEKRLTIFNGVGKCGRVIFPKEGVHAPVRVEVTFLGLEKHIGSLLHFEVEKPANYILQDLVSGEKWGIGKCYNLGD
ncbi:hypothetical protein K8R30_00995 [archaeon]|nr:hypothetical protein [archaeon]